MKVINASKGKCGNHKLKCPHVTLQHTSVQEVSMSVNDKKRASHRGPQCTKCAIDCITSDIVTLWSPACALARSHSVPALASPSLRRLQ